jgi:hypothetical protein
MLIEIQYCATGTCKICYIFSHFYHNSISFSNDLVGISILVHGLGKTYYLNRKYKIIK